MYMCILTLMLKQYAQSESHELYVSPMYPVPILKYP